VINEIVVVLQKTCSQITYKARHEHTMFVVTNTPCLFETYYVKLESGKGGN